MGFREIKRTARRVVNRILGEKITFSRSGAVLGEAFGRYHPMMTFSGDLSGTNYHAAEVAVDQPTLVMSYEDYERLGLQGDDLAALSDTGMNLKIAVISERDDDRLVIYVERV